MELLWAAAVLMLLGAAISLCVKCQLSATKREKQLSDQRSQLESQQRFEVIRSHSTVTRRLEQIKEPVNLSTARKTAEELGTYCHVGYGNRTECRYQNFLTEDCLRGDTGDAAYVEPIPLDYYNRARFLAPPRAEKEEDSHSYQNVIIGESHSSDPASSCPNSSPSQMMTETMRTAQRYTYGNSSERKLCRRRAPMTSQTMLTRSLRWALPFSQRKVFCIESEEAVRAHPASVCTGRRGDFDLCPRSCRRGAAERKKCSA